MILENGALLLTRNVPKREKNVAIVKIAIVMKQERFLHLDIQK